MAGPCESWLEELTEADDASKKMVYLITISRVLSERLQGGDLRDVTTLTRQDVQECVLDAWENPVHSGRGGRPRQSDGGLVKKMVVFQESHADGARHFHVAVLLNSQMRFAAVKRTLLDRHHLPSHFSTTHQQWWSAVKYGCEATPKKPVVDTDPLQWVPPGAASIDLFEDSQQPFQAGAWVKRREGKDRESLKKGEHATFTKLDFTALVLAKNLRSKASVLKYFQDHGTVAMQAFGAKHQRKQDEYLEDAFEWSVAGDTAAAESMSDWALLCTTADKECPLGDTCPCHLASQAFFQGNAANFTMPELAEALRKVIVGGPSKHARVPFLVGPTNTGKSSLVESFDALFGATRVYHLPAITDKKYALRNWLLNKRFVFWDEFDPVAYAHAGVLPAAQFKKAFNGQWFEIQVPQNFHDGNKDFRWRRGAVFTNKEEDLWRPTDRVRLEDVRHLQSRVHQFSCTAVFVPPGEGRPEIPQCAHHLAKWVQLGADRFDAQSVLGARVLPSQDAVVGLREVLSSAALPERVSTQLMIEIRALGAIHVNELRLEDWQGLPSWPNLRELEKRRVLRSIGVS